MSDRRDVTGVWYGRWSSSDSDVEPNSFIATLDESAAVVSGTITERHPAWSDTIRADVNGMRTGGSIEFTKQYDGDGPMSHAVHYAGTIDAAGTEIRGSFRFGAYSGGFTMTRETFDADELEDAEQVEIREPVKAD